MVYDGHRVGADCVLGGDDGLGHGLGWILGALEVGRINIAARAVRRGPRRVRGRDPLRAGAHDVRQADRRAPGDPAEARRHGDEARRRRGCSPQHAADLKQIGRAGRRRGRAWRSSSRARPRSRSRPRPAHPRRRRLHDRAPDRALLPGRAADDHRRGHQRDPAPRDRPRPAPALRDRLIAGRAPTARRRGGTRAARRPSSPTPESTSTAHARSAGRREQQRDDDDERERGERVALERVEVRRHDRGPPIDAAANVP